MFIVCKKNFSTRIPSRWKVTRRHYVFFGQILYGKLLPPTWKAWGCDRSKGQRGRKARERVGETPLISLVQPSSGEKPSFESGKYWNYFGDPFSCNFREIFEFFKIFLFDCLRCLPGIRMEDWWLQSRSACHAWNGNTYSKAADAGGGSMTADQSRLRAQRISCFWFPKPGIWEFMFPVFDRFFPGPLNGSDDLWSLVPGMEDRDWWATRLGLEFYVSLLSIRHFEIRPSNLWF